MLLLVPLLITSAYEFHQPAIKRLEQTRQKLSCHSGLLLVDGNNVRAATGFRYTAVEMNACLDAWARRSSYAGRTAIIWDHGEQYSARLSSGTSVLLSGPSQSADDVIVQACGFLASGGDDIMVVTSDQALRGRCRSQLVEAASTDCDLQKKRLENCRLGRR